VVEEIRDLPGDFCRLAVLRGNDDLGRFLTDFFADAIDAVAQQPGRVTCLGRGVATGGDRIAQMFEGARKIRTLPRRYRL
jgi:hypothetical protein